MVEAKLALNSDESEAKFVLLVMQKTLKLLGEPPCSTVEEGRALVLSLVKCGKFS